MEGEFMNLIKVWISAITSLCYCYYISARVPKGLPRLLTLLPIIYLFLLLPFNLSTVHFCGITAFCLAWLANFKLLLFSFDLPPLSPPPPKLSHFITIACLPIKVKTTLTPPSSPPQKPLLAVKVVVLAFVFYLYQYRQILPKNVVRILNCCHIYLELELALALFATLARTLLGYELEPQFNEPYLATSLQDFWGRRWNLMVTRILHPAIYSPIRRIFTRVLGQEWARFPAVLGAFFVSGLIHELIFYYCTHVYPTWELTLFFSLHGFCVAMEIVMKKAVLTNSRRLPPAISVPLTVGFVVVTGFWLFFAPLVRHGLDEKFINEGLVSFKLVNQMLPLPLISWHK